MLDSTARAGYPRFGTDECQQIASLDTTKNSAIDLKDWVITGALQLPLLAVALTACAGFLAF